MRYKGGYKPSQLLCTSSLLWLPLESCRPALEQQRHVVLGDCAASSAQQQPAHAQQQQQPQSLGPADADTASQARKAEDRCAQVSCSQSVK